MSGYVVQNAKIISFQQTGASAPPSEPISNVRRGQVYATGGANAAIQINGVTIPLPQEVLWPIESDSSYLEVTEVDPGGGTIYLMFID
ncbi:hypothetical protein [Phaeocystidibacter luteus]|uniref:Uncharacterized protein n=1 Tax=Phaeocystidibacter luteus TaxID=911197 RepID=A0A6N6RLW4_9FLAO|nr:hypothetical protein [Phaeocystidibacter luteus]KAB2814558.1 hypothetical protein F8C67_02125 [Phaeocystidibacter luteus]